MNDIDTNAKVIWEYMLMRQELRPMDAIFALGSNDIRVATRAAELFLQGFGRHCIFAGNTGKEGAGFGKPEAEAFKDAALGMGVPEEKIITECRSTNTGENIHFVRALLEDMNLHLSSFLLVQKPYAERRVYAAFKKQWPEAECTVTSPLLSYEEYCEGIDKEKFISVMVGDLDRIAEYPKLGLQIRQDIPPAVWEARNKLVAGGFGKYALV